MKKNIGNNDRALRIILGAVILPSSVTGSVLPLNASGIWTYILAVLGICFLVTGATGYSWIYDRLGLDTSKAKSKPAAKKRSTSPRKTSRKTSSAKKRTAPARKTAAKRKTSSRTTTKRKTSKATSSRRRTATRKKK